LTEYYGGLRNDRIKQEAKVYICDLAGLQFQQPYNSGRLVLIEEEPIEGLVDDLIYQNVVNEKKAKFEEVSEIYSNTGRYIKLRDDCFFDSVAYKKFVTNDVILTIGALNDYVHLNQDQLNFKFLKYGSGYFAGSFKIREQLEKNILDAVIDGLEIAFGKYKIDSIKSVEFAFYNFSDEQKNRLQSLCEYHHKK